MDRNDRALTPFGPYPPNQWLQPDTMLILRPEFECGLWMLLFDGFDLRTERFLKTACSSALALACRGRGSWALYPNRLR